MFWAIISDLIYKPAFKKESIYSGLTKICVPFIIIISLLESPSYIKSHLFKGEANLLPRKTVIFGNILFAFALYIN